MAYFPDNPLELLVGVLTLAFFVAAGWMIYADAERSSACPAWHCAAGAPTYVSGTCYCISGKAAPLPKPRQ